MPTEYQKLLEMVLNPDVPDPTIVVYNERHMATLRAGLSRAKRQANTLRSFTGDEDLDKFIFKYTPNPDRPHQITISLVPAPSPFAIVYPEDEGTISGESKEVLNNMAGFKTST